MEDDLFSYTNVPETVFSVRVNKNFVTEIATNDDDSDGVLYVHATVLDDLIAALQLAKARIERESL